MAGILDGRREFERMMARHKAAIDEARDEIDRVRHELDDRLERMRAEMNAVRDEIERAVRRGVDPFPAARTYRDRWGLWPEVSRRKRRPWRGFEGGDPLPVEPCPKPQPLIGGAEAPID
jgi:hypothetical protein